jgi:hypothetical protein
MGRRSTVARRFAALCLPAPLCLLSFGCARALKEPRPISELADAPAPADTAEVAGLMTRAEALLAERDLDKAKEAALLFLRAASAKGAPIDALLGALRAEVWVTDHAPDPRVRAQSAAAAVEAAQWCTLRAPLDPACDYWRGAALGVQARERPSTALSALPQIVQAFKHAARLLPTLDEAGPERALALLYVRAPGWPSGPGNPDLGLEHARVAVDLKPAYPPNQLALAEALLATGDAGGSRLAFKRALELARGMAEQGDRDAPEWVAQAEKGLREAAD